MPWIVQHLWLIPALPLVAAGASALTPRPGRRLAAALAIGSMAGAFLLSLCAFAHVLGWAGEPGRAVFNFDWFSFAAGPAGALRLGWVLDPLAAVMLVMVSFVGLVIFIYSVGYMAHDENFTRFFTFLSLFAGAMLGLVIANSLVLLFICWELVGLTSYLLIGFWYHKPAAAAAATKAFITTRIGDLALLLGLVWLYYETGTLVVYDGGAGCLEQGALAGMVAKTTSLGMAVSTAIGLLIFAGAVGKSGQVPLHVWLPDAMEGPTPVSALIHAATMVAAGVFLVARVFPLMQISPHFIVEGDDGWFMPSTALQVITWVGAITAVFAASVAVAQNDLKRILAYSTISQLGYMMLGLGTGGVAVGMFHLITHAFFKALLFLGAGSVIHGSHQEQDIRRMGGLRPFMPVTFATYAVGMLALCGFPLLFSGFWSKDAILHAAQGWSGSRVPFYLGVVGAFLTAFYMTRQVALVFFGFPRSQRGSGLASAPPPSPPAPVGGHEGNGALPELCPLTPTLSPGGGEGVRRTREGGFHRVHGPDARPTLGVETPHESPPVMTGPLIILAACTLGLSAIGTPAWPWFQEFLGAGHAAHGFNREVIALMLLSTAVVMAGLGAGWWLYGRRPPARADAPDVLARLPAGLYTWLERKLGVDELYEISVIRLHGWFARTCHFLDAVVWSGAVKLLSGLTAGMAWASRALDEFGLNPGFDQGCAGISGSGRWMARLQNGRVQNYLRVLGVALTVLAILLLWGGRP